MEDKSSRDKKEEENSSERDDTLEVTSEIKLDEEIDEITDEEPVMRQKGLNFDQYLGGSSIAFSLGTLLMLLTAWSLQLIETEFSVPLKLAINIIPTMIGSFVATYLFTRISRIKYVQDGIIIGFGGFIISFLYTSLLGQGVGGGYILIGFLLGGLLGGFITKIIYEKNP